MMHNERARRTIFDVGDKLIGRILRIAVALLVLVSGASNADSITHHYTVTVDYSLNTLWVEARFSRPVVSVTARSRNAGKFLTDARSCNDQQQIKMRNRRMMLPENGISCLNYTVDLARAAKEQRNNRLLEAGNIIASPSHWLWRPELNNGTSIQIEFRLPENVRVSVPWQQAINSDTTYLLSASPESANAPAVFGNFDYRKIEIPGAVLRVSILNGINPMDNDRIARWIEATSTDVTLAYGRFPNPSPQVVVVAVGDGRSNSRSVVPFGRVIRDGGETVELFVDQTQPIDALLGDWTATHEFSHMMLPYVDSRQRWISEGFAQYYQNVLLTRSGAYDEQYAWQKLYDGLERGRNSRPELSPNEATAAGIRSSRMKVYWSGAAIALMADVALRERSNGRESLDTVLNEFQACCLPSANVWSGKDLFEKFDSLVDEPIFMPLYRRYADTAGFPDTIPTLRKLGLEIDDGEVDIRRGGELASIRRAITRTDYGAADKRERLAANQ